MITPGLLGNGSGTRLRPISRKSYPKQFVRLVGDESLFAASAKRLSRTGYAKPVVVTGLDFRFIATEQLLEAGIDSGTILIEPDAGNTAPAVLAAAQHLGAHDPEALILIAPSDHAIIEPAAFRAAADPGVPAAKAGQIVTFGIVPTDAETGYGWLELAAPASADPVPLRRFVEKPDAARAQDMRASGGFLWNGGIFLASARTMIAAFESAALSLQSHFHRPEPRIVVSGTAKVTVNATEQVVTEDQSLYFQLGARHRMEIPGRVPMVPIEVQTGTYLGEYDIVSSEDVYARGQGAKR